MVVKTITITEEAYKSIKKMKKPDESFSRLFLRLSQKKLTADQLFGVLRDTGQSTKEWQQHIRTYSEQFSKDSEEKRNALIRQLRNN